MIRPLLLAMLLLAAPARAEVQPVFSPTGPDAEAYGADAGYPIPASVINARTQRYIVGAFSHQDSFLASRVVKAPPVASVLRRAEREIALSYTYRNSRETIDSYLDRHPTTGLLILRDGTILMERYRYARRDTQRFLSQSMAKTITAMLVGIAVAEGKIRSIDDPARAYVPELGRGGLGAITVRALLTMSSGLAFTETYDGTDDSARMSRELWRRGSDTAGVLAGFDRREAEPGARFHYAGRDTAALGLVLRRATGEHLAELMSSRIWRRIGAEADASWSVTADGDAAPYCCVNAVLRDWGRLGTLLARDGMWDGQQVIPRDWVIAATSAAPAGTPLAPGTATPFFGYGYQTWIFPGPRRQFALLGIHGQSIFVDAPSRLVLVHTAVRLKPSNDPMALELRTLWRALVEQQGR